MKVHSCLERHLLVLILRDSFTTRVVDGLLWLVWNVASVRRTTIIRPIRPHPRHLTPQHLSLIMVSLISTVRQSVIEFVSMQKKKFVFQISDSWKSPKKQACIELMAYLDLHLMKKEMGRHSLEPWEIKGWLMKKSLLSGSMTRVLVHKSLLVVFLAKQSKDPSTTWSSIRTTTNGGRWTSLQADTANWSSIMLRKPS